MRPAPAHAPAAPPAPLCLGGHVVGRAERLAPCERRHEEAVVVTDGAGPAGKRYCPASVGSGSRPSVRPFSTAGTPSLSHGGAGAPFR